MSLYILFINSFLSLSKQKGWKTPPRFSTSMSTSPYSLERLPRPPDTPHRAPSRHYWWVITFLQIKPCKNLCNPSSLFCLTHSNLLIPFMPSQFSILKQKWLSRQLPCTLTLSERDHSGASGTDFHIFLNYISFPSLKDNNTGQGLTIFSVSRVRFLLFLRRIYNFQGRVFLVTHFCLFIVTKHHGKVTEDKFR